jgi:hypothetical protein
MQVDPLAQKPSPAENCNRNDSQDLQDGQDWNAKAG